MALMQFVGQMWKWLKSWIWPGPSGRMTTEEYILQGQVETEKALTELRAHLEGLGLGDQADPRLQEFVATGHDISPEEYAAHSVQYNYD